MAPGDNSSNNGEDFAALLAEYEQSAPSSRGPAVGDVVTGTVVSIGEEAVFVDLGGKAEGILAREQLLDADDQLIVGLGDRVEARVVEVGGESGAVVLRRSLGRGPEAAAELEQAHAHQIPVEGLVTATNKGGFEVQVAGTRGFCPISQMDARFVEDPERFVGLKLQFRITKLETGRGRPNVVLSRRALLEEEAAALAAELRTRLAVGAVLPGEVTRVTDYGAFVDLGGLEGLLHVSELGHARVGHPSEVLSPGQRLEVQVVKIEPGQGGKPEKIGLSLKSLERDPWESVAERFPVGSRVPGLVTRLQPYGAFVEVAAGLEGLIHVSELAERRVSHPREVLEVGERIEVTIVGLEPERRRLSLSLAAAARDAAAREEADNIRAHAPRSQGLGTFADLLKGKLDRD